MTNKILLYTIILSFISFSSWAQKKNSTTNEKKPAEIKMQSSIANGNNPNAGKKIKYYHVEEITPLKFGGFKTTYDVRDPKLIRTYDLGPNNKRTITPVYEDEVQPEQVQPLKADTLKKIVPSAAITVSDKAKRKDAYAYIDIIKTYERVSDKGFESVDMLKKVGDSYFFNDEFEKAESVYTKLFNLTKELGPEYYYRYSISLRAIGKKELADEYFKKFNELSSNQTGK
ncbi:tetratricopeptide repeat protein [Flavobacterium gilvum]|uniref:Tetratricopeptide repeat protein n=1 Tax=Flavobacterium gilvum TaxID=1492737 RepID=A0AAC9N7D8_9FLAO|nr:hypothetical protein [Flavobacterium gilvum]AOW10258.1 hypothetical protein EM308_12495 [Flavobacterium gilvum]KFC59500.1 hypothetical protein FEM08_17440 [Flavobacterium gilvum]